MHRNPLLRSLTVVVDMRQLAIDVLLAAVLWQIHASVMLTRTCGQWLMFSYHPHEHTRSLERYHAQASGPCRLLPCPLVSSCQSHNEAFTYPCTHASANTTEIEAISTGTIMLPKFAQRSVVRAQPVYCIVSTCMRHLRYPSFYGLALWSK